MTKQLILLKSLELFTTKGYEGASMNDIAQAVGIKKASLYSHFDSKDNIFLTIFNSVLEDYISFINVQTVIKDDEDPVDRLNSIFLTYILYCFNEKKMEFWDRYYYYPPEFLKDFIYKKTSETNEMFLEKLEKLFEKWIKKKSIQGKSAHSLTLIYYYLMIGLSMSIKLYDQDQLIAESKSALEGLFIE